MGLTSRRALLTGLAATPIAITITPAVKAMESVQGKWFLMHNSGMGPIEISGFGLGPIKHEGKALAYDFHVTETTAYPLAYGSPFSDGG